ncbi:MAG TPA: helix-hairpin-helix domain-containing protein [Gemmatimonadaceae bacterium]
MPTPAEKKALLFLASVALLGASVRALRAVGTLEKAPAANARALDAQLDAVDSARGAKKGKGKSRAKGGRHRLPPDSLPASDSGLLERLPNGKAKRVLAKTTIDVDLATADQLDALPGVGPVLARRIVADRQQRGSFGSLANLRRVKGIGPALAARLDPLVTFSGTPRPPSATPMDSSATERRRATRAANARRGPSGEAPAPNASVVPTAPGSGFTRPLSSPPPAQWLLPSSPSSESAISSSVRGSSRASSSRARSKSSGRAARGSDTISSSSASSKKTS